MKNPIDLIEAPDCGRSSLAHGSAPYSRADHLAWCKKRALEYVDMGDVNQAFASMSSDLGKHPDTEGHIGIELGMMLLMGGMLFSPAQMRHFIEGFN